MSAQILPLFPRLSPAPRIVFGRALVRRLVHRAAALTGIDAEDILGCNKAHDPSLARFAVFLVLHEQGRAYAQIGRLFDRDHTSVRSGCHRGAELEQADEDFAELVRLLREEAGNG